MRLQKGQASCLHISWNKLGRLPKPGRRTDMDRESLAVLLDARDKLCNYCEYPESGLCEKCQVTIIIDNAYDAYETESEEEQ